MDRKKRVNFFHNLATSSDTLKKPKVVRDAGIALASLVVCEEALERELFISTSYVLSIHYNNKLHFSVSPNLCRACFNASEFTLLFTLYLQLCSWNGSNFIRTPKKLI